MILIKTLVFTAIAAGVSAATAQTAVSQSTPQVNQGTAMSDSTYVQDYRAISEVLNKYIEGCKQAKSSIMKPAFAAEATMYSIDPEGKLVGGAITVLFEAIDKDFRPSPDAEAAITRIEIVGTAASARIDANAMSGISFTDFFHLLKVDGKWMVVSKVFQTHSAP